MVTDDLDELRGDLDAREPLAELVGALVGLDEAGLGAVVLAEALADDALLMQRVDEQRAKARARARSTTPSSLRPAASSTRVSRSARARARASRLRSIAGTSCGSG